MNEPSDSDREEDFSVRDSRPRAKLDSPVVNADVPEHQISDLEKQQKFELVWRDISEAVETQLRDEMPVLIHDANLDVEGKLPSDRSHILIEGDNLHALHVLQATHQRAIDVIYIDPPYNRGKDLIYNDTFVDKDDPCRHSKWLSFMSKRLVLAEQLLNEDGVMFISIDDNSQAQLRLLCDQVFGPRSFVANFVWIKKRKASNLDKSVRSITEYVLCYSKNGRSLIHPEDVVEEDKPYPFYNTGNKRKVLSFPKGVKFTSIDNQKLGPQTFRAKKTSVRLLDSVKIVKGVAQNAFRLEGEWRYSQVAVDGMFRAGEEVVFKGTDFKPYLINKSEDRFKLMRSLLSAETYGIGTNEDGTEELFQLIGKNDFDYPKPVSLVHALLAAALRPDHNSLVLDFFAGSGTTLEAVARLNSETGASHQCILATNNENGICRDIAIPRVTAVLTGMNGRRKIREALPGSLSFFKTGFVKRSKSPDRMRAEIAKYTVDLIAVKEGTGKTVLRSANMSILHGVNKTVVVAPGLESDHSRLCTAAENKVRPGNRKVVYVFTWSDYGVEEEVAALWPGWDVNPLPAEMLAALRRLVPPARLFDAPETAS